MAENDAFNRIDFNALDAQSKHIMGLNAKSQGMTAQEYYESRGGVNKAGYYGDSYKEGVTLNDKEYFDTLNNAIKSGLTGGMLGSAINEASNAKKEAFKKKMGFTNNDQLQAYLKGTTEDFERYWRQQDEAEARRVKGGSGGFSGSKQPSNPQPVSPTPQRPTPQAPASPPPPPVKTAPIDTILFDDDTVSIETITDLLFENIGGQEIISIVRNDTVNGQDIVYQPIKNVSLIQKQYNPNNILALQATSSSYFANFAIKYENKLPLVGNGPNGETVYLDTSNGDIIVELVNVYPDEEAEIEFIVGGTIYEAEI